MLVLLDIGFGEIKEIALMFTDMINSTRPASIFTGQDDRLSGFFVL